ncbi:MAG: hypothetical protein QOF51_2733 [Chloroflexota bacterium]|nr:hypothetical protein [Chloroflexota bacterium]
MRREQIEQCLLEVGAYLDEQGLIGEILLLGGAYMTLVLQQREATMDVDAYFATNAAAIREAGERVAAAHGLPADWLNDAVKGFLYVQPTMVPWRDYPGLRIYAPPAEYIFAMKALAGRPGDVRDLEILRDMVDITTMDQALGIVTRYIPERLLAPRIRYLLEDLIGDEPR